MGWVRGLGHFLGRWCDGLGRLWVAHGQKATGADPMLTRFIPRG